MVVSCSGGQCVAHFAQAPVAGSVDGENRLNTFGELGGRFTADEYFMLRNLQRTDGLDLMNEFPGTFAVGDDEERPTGFALAPVALSHWHHDRTWGEKFNFVS